LSSHSDLPTEVAALHRRVPAIAGETLKRAVALAIREYPMSKGPKGLAVLARVAGRIRASSRCVPPLVDLVTRYRTALHKPGTSLFSTIQECVSVLAGFAPDDHIGLLFEGLAFDDDVAPQLSAVLMVGLTICDPESFAKYLDRYVKRRKCVEGFFNDAVVLQELFRAVPPAVVRARFEKLTDGAKQYLVKYGGPLFDPFGIHAFDTEHIPGVPAKFEDLSLLFEAIIPAGGVMSSWYTDLATEDSEPDSEDPQ